MRHEAGGWKLEAGAGFGPRGTAAERRLGRRHFRVDVLLASTTQLALAGGAWTALLAPVVAFVALRARRSAARTETSPTPSRRLQAPMLDRPCPSCGARVLVLDTRCGQCSATLPARRLLCPKCGIAARGPERFCKRCRTALAG